jgi:two-component system cell cycle response regulator
VIVSRAGVWSEAVAPDRDERVELERLRRLYERQEARVRELEAAQHQLLIYARDLQGTFRELRRQLTRMNELHDISTVIGAVLEPKQVMARTLDGLGRLVESDVTCIYLVEDGSGVRRVTRGTARNAPPREVKLGDGALGTVLAGRSGTVLPSDGLTLTVGMRSGGVTVGALHLVRDDGGAFGEDDRKLVELVAAEAGAAIQNARLHEQTQRLATMDPHTGLFNFRYFRDALELEIARARRLGYAVGVLMIDLDNFKRVNDTYGHPVGDEVLRDVAMALRQNLRRTDVAARYGGEEFAIILPGLSAAGLRAVGEKLRRAVSALGPIQTQPDGPALSISVSIGGMSAVPFATDASGLIREADAALYEAKRAGKDCIFVIPDRSPVDEPTASGV